jgi:hypothetical protein
VLDRTRSGPGASAQRDVAGSERDSYRPVSDLQPATLAVAWPQDARSAAVAAFVRTAASVAAATAVETEYRRRRNKSRGPQLGIACVAYA